MNDSPPKVPPPLVIFLTWLVIKVAPLLSPSPLTIALAVDWIFPTGDSFRRIQRSPTTCLPAPSFLTTATSWLGVTPPRPRSRHSGAAPCQVTLSISIPEEHFRISCDQRFGKLCVV